MLPSTVNASKWKDRTTQFISCIVLTYVGCINCNSIHKKHHTTRRAILTKASMHEIKHTQKNSSLVHENCDMNYEEIGPATIWLTNTDHQILGLLARWMVMTMQTNISICQGIETLRLCSESNILRIDLILYLIKLTFLPLLIKVI